MVSFESDYIAGAHPKVLDALVRTNLEALPGYGSDCYCKSAADKIRIATGDKDADVFFLVGGTQTNSVIITSYLHEYDGVIAATTGHVALHEAGAIEGTGHKVLAIDCDSDENYGKIKASTLRQYLEDFYNGGNHEHMVAPGMVYISHPTEYGTLYTKNELTAISGICREYGIPLFLDGARLGYGLMSHDTDVTLEDIDRLTDVFYIGGTKVGALCGEAVVFPRIKTPESSVSDTKSKSHPAGFNPEFIWHAGEPSHFVTTSKRHGALLAKGRLLGVQFDTLFTDDLYFEISKHAIDMAERMIQIFHDKNMRFFLESPTNQQFIILSHEENELLKDKIAYSFWQKFDEDHIVVRFATSWSTTDADMEALEKAL